MAFKFRMEPSTCYCIYESDRPSLQGEYIQRCRIHINSRDTREAYQYNIDNQERQDPDEESRTEKMRVTRENTLPFTRV